MKKTVSVLLAVIGLFCFNRLDASSYDDIGDPSVDYSGWTINAQGLVVAPTPNVPSTYITPGPVNRPYVGPALNAAIIALCAGGYLVDYVVKEFCHGPEDFFFFHMESECWNATHRGTNGWPSLSGNFTNIPWDTKSNIYDYRNSWVDTYLEIVSTWVNGEQDAEWSYVSNPCHISIEESHYRLDMNPEENDYYYAYYEACTRWLLCGNGQNLNKKNNAMTVQWGYLANNRPDQLGYFPFDTPTSNYLYSKTLAGFVGTGACLHFPYKHPFSQRSADIPSYDSFYHFTCAVTPPWAIPMYTFGINAEQFWPNALESCLWGW